MHQLLAVDGTLLADNDMRWQAQLLGSFSADLFLPHEYEDPSDDSQVILDTSMSLLLLKSQLADLKNENNSLSSEHKKLVAENKKLKVQNL